MIKYGCLYNDLKAYNRHLILMLVLINEGIVKRMNFICLTLFMKY